MLYYPTYYEGLEQSPNILYPAQEATQSVVAAVNWLAANRGKDFYLIGSDYIWPRTTNKIAKPTIAKAGAKVAGEDYFPLGHIEFGSVINKIKASGANVVLSTMVGGSNVAFYKQITAAGIDPKKITILALAVSEEELSGIGAENVQGVLTCTRAGSAAWSIFRTPASRSTSRPRFSTSTFARTLPGRSSTSPRAWTCRGRVESCRPMTIFARPAGRSRRAAR